MGFSCGIVGLPNVGKSTLFNALTSAAAAAENYPFCTVEPNHGVVAVADERLAAVAACYQPDKITPTSLEFVDIAGLVKGASTGEGLGNQFLGQIQAVDAIAHVVRCFEDPNVSHVYESVDPVRDIGIVEAELMIRDLEVAERRLEKQRKVGQGGDGGAKAEVPILERIIDALNRGEAARRIGLGNEELETIRESPLLTLKPSFYIANIDDSKIGSTDEPTLVALSEFAREEALEWTSISAGIEAELNNLPLEERREFQAELGLTTRGLERVVQVGYRVLGSITFFTTVGTEVRAWTVPAGTKAVAAAGRIHTDMERGFIRAEVIPASELTELGSEQAARDQGFIRAEGRDYLVQDGDVIRFRFNG